MIFLLFIAALLAYCLVIGFVNLLVLEVVIFLRMVRTFLIPFKAAEVAFLMMRFTILIVDIAESITVLAVFKDE